MGLRMIKTHPKFVCPDDHSGALRHVFFLDDLENQWFLWWFSTLGLALSGDVYLDRRHYGDEPRNCCHLGEL